MAAQLTNNPPDDADPLTERLCEDYADLLGRARELLVGVGNFPSELDAVSHDRAAGFVAQIRACMAMLEDARTAEKLPFLDAGRKVDGFFAKPSDRLADGTDLIEQRITAFLKSRGDVSRVRTSMGPTSSLVRPTFVTVTDKEQAAKVLLPFLDDAAWAKAARAWARANKATAEAVIAGSEPIPGLAITQEMKARVG